MGSEMCLRERFIPFIALALLVSCGSKTDNGTKQETEDIETFNASQPLGSGEYRAVYYDITGKNDRKGAFDGRVYTSLSPEMSVFYVFENGNRVKINDRVILEAPLAKNDSVWTALDKSGNPVTLKVDSVYVLNYVKGESKVAITFEKEAMQTATATEIMDRKANKIQK